MMGRSAILLCLAILMSACSTVNRGASDHFRIDTVPQGAKVTTSIIDESGMTRWERRQSKPKQVLSDSDYIGCDPTPCAIRLPRRSEFAAKLEHPGYEPTSIFIRSTTLRGGSTANAAANIATASGTGFAVAGYIAAFEATFTSIFSLGTQTVNTSGLASSGAAAGLGVGVGMMAIDLASGANLNLFPNPVVIELAKEGTTSRSDPLVDRYWDMTKAETLSETICKTRKKDRGKYALSCKEAKADLREKRTAFQTLKREQMEALRTAIKAARKKEKALKTQN